MSTPRKKSRKNLIEMGKRISALLCSLLAVLTLLAQPARAAGVVDLSQRVFLNIAYRDESSPLVGVQIDIYLVAAMDGNGELTVTEEFAPYFDRYNLTISPETWKTLASTLKGPVLLDGLTPTDSGMTDEKGNLSFPNQRRSLEKGLYLVMGHSHTQDDRIYESTPFVVMLPEPEQTGSPEEAPSWNYNVDVVMKFLSRWDTSESGGTVKRKVLKVWSDKGHAYERPQEITVHLLRDGEIYDTVTLNAADNWRYDWPELDKSSEWTVVEAESGGYTVSVEREGITFVVTNSYNPDNPPDYPRNDPDEPPTEDIPDGDVPTTEMETPSEEDFDTPEEFDESEEDIPFDDVPLTKLPQTGQLWWPVPVLLSAGLFLMILGLLRRRGEAV